MSYQLLYFPFRGRAEQVRLLLHEIDCRFEEVAVGKPELIEMKKQGPATLPFGALPVICEGDFRLAQAPCIMGYLGRTHGLAPTDSQQAARAESLCLAAEDLRIKYFGLFGDGADEKQAEFVDKLLRGRWLPNFEALLKLNGATGFFIGDTLTYADVATWDVLDAILRYVKGADLDGFALVKKFYDDVGARPRIKAYVDTRSD